VSARCNAAAGLTLSGTVTAKVKKRKHSQTFRVSTVHASITAGKSLTLTVKLPSGALKALAKGAHESVAFTLTATGANGSSTTTAKIGRLKLKH
jgi:hypothetical protein